MADPKEQEVKQERLAAALRENLKRRKARVRDAGTREQDRAAGATKPGERTNDA